MTTVTVALSQKYFAKGLSYAKRVGGTYNPDTKTWAIPATRPELGAPGAYGWVIVPQAPAPTPLVATAPVVAPVVETADEAAVAQFIATVPATATQEQRNAVAAKVEAMAATGEGPVQVKHLSAATLREVARRLRGDAR